jgi:hypothetical protein
MWLSRLRQLVRGPQGTAQPARKRGRPRPRLEQLEDRTLPATFYAATAPELIADINAANQGGGSNTIILTVPTTAPYDLTAVNNTTDGPTGLPVIAAGDNLTIAGNGDTIDRSTAAAFRLFDVAAGATLTLQSLILQNGLAFGEDSAARGGAIYNQGALDLSGVTVRGNRAQGYVGGDGECFGGNGADAAGGGIWSGGSLVLENGTAVQNNSATGGRGGDADGGEIINVGGMGGNAWGGGLYVAGGTANLAGATLSDNLAQGGDAGLGNASFGPGNGSGGALYVAAGRVTLTGDVVQNNIARGGLPDSGGTGVVSAGGGVSIEPATTVYLDPFTVPTPSTTPQTSTRISTGRTARSSSAAFPRRQQRACPVLSWSTPITPATPGRYTSPAATPRRSCPPIIPSPAPTRACIPSPPR